MKTTLALMTGLLLACINCTTAAHANDKVTEPPMAAIRAGTLIMGDPAAKPLPNFPAALPVHAVTIPAFQMAKYETTVGQYRQFVEATGYQGANKCWRLSTHEWGIEMDVGNWEKNSLEQSEHHPVTCISWTDAKAYTAWLATQTGKPYRLASEAEWEYAARAGSTARHHFGDDVAQLCRYANIGDTVGRAAIDKATGKVKAPVPCNDGAAFTTVVGTYEPNAFGLYDMLGNVNELVADCEHLTYDGAPTDGSAWSTDCKTDMKMRRGTNFASAGTGGSASRGHFGTSNASIYEGFRLALGSAPPATIPASAQRFEQALAKAKAAELARREGTP